MAHINDLRFNWLRGEGYTGSVDDMLLQWLRDNGATSGNINDAWREFLAEQGFDSGNYTDDLYAYLGSLGYTGALTDRIYQWWGGTGGAGPAPNPILLAIQLQNSLIPSRAVGSGTPTFTRSTVATVTDFEGLVKNVLSGEARFMGARRVANFVTYSADFSNASWLLGGGGARTEVLVNQVAAPDGTMTADLVRAKTGTTAGEQYARKAFTYTETRAGSIYVKKSNWRYVIFRGIYADIFDFDTQTFTLNTSGNAAFEVLPNGWFRIYQKGHGTGGTDYFSIGPADSGTTFTWNTPPSGNEGVYVWGAQLENVTGQATQTPGEYVSTNVLSAPFHGAGIDGVKYFTTKLSGAAIGASDYLADASGPFGYVSEGARTNLCKYSENFSNATGWVQTFSIISENTTVGPSGAQVADTVTAKAGGISTFGGLLRSNSAPTYSANTTYTMSCYAKAGTAQYIGLRPSSGCATAVDEICYFNLSTGVATAITPASGTVVSVGMTPFPDDWYRCFVVYTTSGAPGSTTTDIGITNSSGSLRPAYAGTETLYLWGVQVEAGSFPSTYIPTTSAAVTRNAGSGSYASSSNITTANGVMVLEWTPPYTGMGTVALWGSYVDANNYTRIFHDGANIVFRRRVSGVNYDATKALTYAAGTTYKIAARISDATGGDVFVAGVKGTNSSNTSALQLGANFSVGHDGNGANHSFAPIRNVKHYDTALTDVQVAAI